MPNPKFTGKSLLQLLQEQLQAYSGDGCLLWEYATNAKGYGIMKVAGKATLAHRVAYEIIHGHAPDGALRQTCGNRRCFAPPHLVLGQRTNLGRNFDRSFEKFDWLVKMLASDETDDCVVWPFAKDPSGYGVVVTPDGERVYAHRLAFKLTHGHWPEPVCLHSCDNPPCFKPRHLSEGTQAENNHDMKQKGRANSPRLKGEDHGRAKLTEEQVRDIRARFPIEGAAQLAREYGVAPIQIRRIVNRECWNHIH